MRISEQLSVDDPGEPPSLLSDENYFNLLFAAHDRLNIFPPYPVIANQTGEFEVRLFDDYDSIEIEASLHGELAEAYCRLNSDQRYELGWCIERAVGEMAVSLFETGESDSPVREPVALINHSPVIFEPINNAMLVGQWEDWERKKMNIRSQFIESREQQRLLLGGLAAFVTYLEQR
jgi:hypothetical protein